MYEGSLKLKYFFVNSIFLVPFIMLSSCFVPETKPNKNYNCQLVTNEWSLEVKGLDNSDAVLIEGLSGATRSCQDDECLFLFSFLTLGR